MPAISDPMSTWEVTKLIFPSVGSLIVGLLIGKRTKRWDRTLELYNEFNSVEMVNIRTSVYTFIENHKPIDMSDRDLHVKHAKEFDKLWVLMYFYIKLYKLIENDQLVNRLVVPLFGETFAWWYAYFFSEQRPAYEEFKAISHLYDWIEERSHFPFHGKIFNFDRSFRNNILGLKNNEAKIEEWSDAGRKARLEQKPMIKEPVATRKPRA